MQRTEDLTHDPVPDLLELGETCAGCDCDLYLVGGEDEAVLFVECDCASSVVAA
jgi:hypothetical protein